MHYGVELYGDDDFKNGVLVSSFEALMSPFPPHHGLPFPDLNINPIFLWKFIAHSVC